MYVQCTSSQMEVCMEGDDVKGFIYVWDKRFLIVNSGWDCFGYSAAYDCSSGADFWQDGASSWWGILDQMRTEKFSLVKQGRVKAGHIDVLQMEYILDVMDQVCIQANLKLLIVLFRCSCTGLGLWNIIHTCCLSRCSHWQCLQVILCLSSRLWLQEWQVGPQRARNRIGIFY